MATKRCCLGSGCQFKDTHTHTHTHTHMHALPVMCDHAQAKNHGTNTICVHATLSLQRISEAATPQSPRGSHSSTLDAASGWSVRQTWPTRHTDDGRSQWENIQQSFPAHPLGEIVLRPRGSASRNDCRSESHQMGTSVRTAQTGIGGGSAPSLQP